MFSDYVINKIQNKNANPQTNLITLQYTNNSFLYFKSTHAYNTMSEKIVQSSNDEAATLTAVDYIQNQEELEKEARELMPYDPK